jgi:signal transduction histidine kinase
MKPETERSDAMEDLRRLAAADPKRARAVINDLVRTGGEGLREVLTSASRPGEGRVRQMIAAVYRTDKSPDVLESWLREWLKVESDEFTRVAIEAALTKQEAPVNGRLSVRSQAVEAVEAYRFVADRLCHRIRNAMTLPNAHIKRFEEAVGHVADPVLKADLTQILAGVQTGFVRIARNVEFDIGDDYLIFQNVSLVSWIVSMERDFAARFGPARVIVNCDPVVRRSQVRASRFFLETIFGNLFANAIQAGDRPATLELQIALDEVQGRLDVLVLDNGPGFSEEHLDIAFQQVFSTKSPSRGRGLLEIADAVARLQGTVELVKRRVAEYRVHIVLPAVIE